MLSHYCISVNAVVQKATPVMIGCWRVEDVGPLCEPISNLPFTEVIMEYPVTFHQGLLQCVIFVVVRHLGNIEIEAKIEK